MLTRPDKDALRAILESQAQEKLRIDPEVLTTYAAQLEPERKPYTSKPTVQDKAFEKELDQMRADAAAGAKHKPTHGLKNKVKSSLELDDYLDL
ncbi:hypothetical protein [Pseudomonas svalbardensis]|uniref:hypothetical protein n=1 Tax=Pseudomonas svalbardensis TaxID=3042029 RepID=UPI0024B34C21|nr:hypothetical protein [Pseudomonas sp. PMCC200367]